MEKDTCRRMFGQVGGSKSSHNSSGKANSIGGNGDYISPAELAKIRSLYVERFRQVCLYSYLLGYMVRERERDL